MPYSDTPACAARVANTWRHECAQKSGGRPLSLNAFFRTLYGRLIGSDRPGLWNTNSLLPRLAFISLSRVCASAFSGTTRGFVFVFSYVDHTRELIQLIPSQ